MSERSKLGIEKRPAPASDLRCGIDEEVASLLDKRAAALAGDPNQKKFTLQQVFDRKNIK